MLNNQNKNTKQVKKNLKILLYSMFYTSNHFNLLGF